MRTTTRYLLQSPCIRIVAKQICCALACCIREQLKAISRVVQPSKQVIPNYKISNVQPARGRKHIKVLNMAQLRGLGSLIPLWRQQGSKRGRRGSERNTVRPCNSNTENMLKLLKTGYKDSERNIGDEGPVVARW